MVLDGQRIGAAIEWPGEARRFPKRQFLILFLSLFSHIYIYLTSCLVTCTFYYATQTVLLHS